MKTCYIASKYTAPTTYEVKLNCYKAEMIGMEVAKLGIVPLVPHTNTMLWDGIQDPQWWYEATMELMRRCDAVLADKESLKTSKGVRDEVKEADHLGIPVFYNLSDLKDWLDKQNAQEEILLRNDIK